MPEPHVKYRSPVTGDPRQQQVDAAETRLLYDNACTGIVATLVIAAVLAYAQWDVGSGSVVAAWLLYVLLVSVARYLLVRRYRRARRRERSTAAPGAWHSRLARRWQRPAG